MYVQLDCIALRTTRYKDRHSILSALTRQNGLMSMLIPAGNGREAARRRALLLPGSRFGCVADLRDVNGRIPPIRDVIARGASAMSADPFKPAVTLFVVDFLHAIMRESQPDPLLFDYIDSMLELLDTLSGRRLANFHLLFLLKISRYLGVEPDVATYSPGYTFDMVDAVFRPSAPLHDKFLDPVESASVALLMRMTARNFAHFTFSRAERNRAVDVILQYYTIHFASLQSMKSLDIVRSLFA